MRDLVKNLKYVFEPSSVAIIGASNTPNKLGNVLMKNFTEGGFEGKVIPVNPKYETVSGKKCYQTITSVSGRIDCAIIATPAETVPQVLEECGKKGIRGAIVLSSGFGESGKTDLENKLREAAERNDIACIGPNCLGVLNPYNHVDSIFLPMYKMERPKPGSISFITQSGGVGTCIVDVAAHYSVGFSKFVSYGNGAVINEIDLLEYFIEDKKTEEIVLYLEGTKDGRRLLEVMKWANKEKPIIALKAGKYGGALKAAKSHTGNLAGNYTAYKAAFRQAKITEAESLDELFNFVKIFRQPLPKGRRIMVITNGGGLGVLAADAMEENGLMLAEPTEETLKKCSAAVPSYATVSNPLDMTADATVEGYATVIDAVMDDENIDGIILMALLQTPNLDERMLDVLIKASDDRRKPIVAVAVGGHIPMLNEKSLMVVVYRRMARHSQQYAQ